MKTKKEERKIDASGSATNAGIDYQQRVGAWFLVSQYTNFNISKTIDIDRDLEINSVNFETIDYIDDIRIDCKEISIYCQVKRKISTLSLSSKSDFNKSIKQFISSFINEYSLNKIYVLITTSESTSKLKKNLKKILTSIRLNDTNFKENPLNKSEENTFKTFRTQFFHLYKDIKGLETDETNFIKFCKQVFISIIDLEEGSSNINAALMLLKSRNFQNPELIWKLLLSNCLTYASKRQSVNKNYIDGLLSQFSSTNNKIEDDDIDSNFSCGKDIILVESFIEKADFLIIELFRFNDVGIPKLTYRDKKLVISGKDEITEWSVIFRCSTISGMIRYLEENKRLFGSNKIATLEADSEIEQVESLPHVIAYKERFKDILSENIKKWNCLHCGMSISLEDAYLVEIDEIGMKHSLGPIHKDCHRNLDRVLGITGLKNTSTKSKLKNFDYNKWILLLIKGQGQITAIKNMNYGSKKPIISYNFEREINEGAYCIRVTHEDKSYSYLYNGHEIERYNKEEGQHMLEHLKFELANSNKLNDPIYSTNINYNRARYSELVKLKKVNEKLIKVIQYEMIKYSAMLSKINETIEHDYAPVCLLYDKKTQELIFFSNIMPIITDPLKFEDFYENWTKAGFEIDECELKIIDNDKDFGLYLLRFFEDGYKVIIDPEFDLEKNIINGFPIVKQQELIEQKLHRTKVQEFKCINNPIFLKGDKVRVIFPDIKQEKYPEGVLLEDEMENEQGERFVVFQPVENGVYLDFMYSMPSKLMEKI